MLATACYTFPLAEMEGIISRAQNFSSVVCYLCLEGQQSLIIRFIPTKITRGASIARLKSKSWIYVQQYTEQEKNGLEVIELSTVVSFSLLQVKIWSALLIQLMSKFCVVFE